MACRSLQGRAARVALGICAAGVLMACVVLHGIARLRREPTLSARTGPTPLRASGAAQLIVSAASADEALSAALGERIGWQGGEDLRGWPGFLVTSWDGDTHTGAEVVLGRAPAAREGSLWSRLGPREEARELRASGRWSWECFVLWTGRDYEFLTARGMQRQGTGASPLAPALYWQLCRINVSHASVVLVPGSERIGQVSSACVTSDRSQVCIAAGDELLLVDLPDGGARSIWGPGTGPSVPVGQASYSPDGGQIAFADRCGSSPAPRKGVFITSPDSGRWRQLTFASGLNSHLLVRWAAPRTVVVMRRVAGGIGRPCYELWSVRVPNGFLDEAGKEE